MFIGKQVFQLFGRPWPANCFSFQCKIGSDNWDLGSFFMGWTISGLDWAHSHANQFKYSSNGKTSRPILLFQTGWLVRQVKQNTWTYCTCALQFGFSKMLRNLLSLAMFVQPEHLKTGALIYYELVQCDRVDIFSFAYPGVSLLWKTNVIFLFFLFLVLVSKHWRLIFSTQKYVYGQGKQISGMRKATLSDNVAIAWFTNCAS